MQLAKKPDGKIRFITTRTAFIVTLIVAVLTILFVWFSGLGSHRTLFYNSLLSTTLLSVAFFLFLTINLYQGVKLKDDLGRITDGIKLNKFPELNGGFDLPAEMPDGDEGCAGVLVGILAWIVVSILLLLLLWLFSTFLWAMILVFAAMLYWIFFRAVRLVLKNANRCKGKLAASAAHGMAYTLLYNFWIYGLILAAHYFVP